MKKRCTNSACRRYFDNKGICPYCGKRYPRTGHLYNLILLDHGSEKIRVIKAIRMLTDCGLKEAKALSENTPCVLLHRVDSGKAFDAANDFKALGASVRVSESC